MTARRYTYGLRIEGIGADTAKVGGQCWCWGRPLSAAQQSASVYEWVGGAGVAQGIVGGIDGSDSTVSLWTADLSTSSIQAEVHLDDVAGRALMRRATEPVGWLGAKLEVADTSVELSAHFNASHVGDVVFVGDEALRLDAMTASSPPTFDVTRGMWGTYAQELPQYTRIFDGLPYRRGREVTLIRYDHTTGDESTRWFGALDDSPPTSDDHTRVSITATEVLAHLARGRVNLGAADITTTDYLDGVGVHPSSSPINVRQRTSGNVLGGHITYRTRVRQYDWDLVDTHFAAFQVGDSLAFGSPLGTFDGALRYVGYSFTNLNAADRNDPPALGGPAFEEIDPLYEVFVVSRELDVIGGVTVDQTRMASSTARLQYPFHPIAVWLALTIDHPDYNRLGPEWNLGAPVSWFDLADIEATIDRTRHVQIDRLVLGWDGEEVTPWTEFKGWCRTYGFFPCLRPDGRISVREAREAGPYEVFGAPSVSALPYRLHWRPSESDGVDIITGTYGALPWSAGAPFVARVMDFTDPSNPVPQFSKRRGVLASRNEAQIDMPTRSESGTLIETLNGMAASRHVGSPTLGLRVDDIGFGHGDFVRLAPLDVRGNVLRDSTGERVAVDSSARWVGIVVGKSSSFEDDTAQIDVHLTNYDGEFPRMITPSARVASASGSTVTLVAGEFTPGGDDGAAFTVGDQVQVWTPTFARRGPEVLVIAAINSHEIVFSTTPAFAPVAGDVIELAHLSTATGYPEDGNPAFLDGLAYAYLGTDAATVGPSGAPAHIYGSGYQP